MFITCQSRRCGHALLVFYLSARGRTLTSGDVTELAHHLLKARIFRTNNHRVQAHLSSKDFHAYWLSLCAPADVISAALVDKRNVFWPNVKVIL